MFSVLSCEYYFEGPGTGKLVSVDKCSEISINSGKSDKQEIPQKYYLFFPKTFHRDEPFHSNDLRSCRKFYSKGKRSRFDH